MPNIEVLTVRGTPRERGIQHGEQKRDQAREFFEKLLKDTASKLPVPHPEQAALAYSTKHIPYTAEYAPDLLEEMKGIAEGAKMTLEQVMFSNCLDEVPALKNPYIGPKHLNSHIPRSYGGDDDGGCTTFAAVPPATADGLVRIGQTYDISDWYEPLSFVLRVEGRGEEPEVLAFTHAGVIGVVALNAHGVGIVQNSLKPFDTQPGAPYPVVVRKVTQAASLGEALESVIYCTRATGANYVMCSPTTAVNLETTATRYEFTYVTSGIWGHSNHYTAPELKSMDARAGAHGSTLLRIGRMNQMLQEKSGRIDDQVCMDLFRDHHDAPNCICRHVTPSRPEYGNGKTVSGIVFVPAQRRVLITLGNPCQEEYADLSMAEPAAVAR